MSKFYVGQRVRIRYSARPKEFGDQAGKEAVVIGHGWREGMHANLVVIDGEPELRADGLPHAFTNDQLEPLQPERNQTIEWSECVWKPEHMRAEA